MHTNLYRVLNDDNSIVTGKAFEDIMGTNTLVFNQLNDFKSLKHILKTMRKNKEPRVILITSELTNTYLEHKAIIRECQIQHKTLYTIMNITSVNSSNMVKRISELYENSFNDDIIRDRIKDGISLTQFNRVK